MIKVAQIVIMSLNISIKGLQRLLFTHDNKFLELV